MQPYMSDTADPHMYQQQKTDVPTIKCFSLQSQSKMITQLLLEHSIHYEYQMCARSRKAYAFSPFRPRSCTKPATRA